MFSFKKNLNLFQCNRFTGCLKQVGDSRDNEGRKRFFPFEPQHHLIPRGFRHFVQFLISQSVSFIFQSEPDFVIIFIPSLDLPWTITSLNVTENGKKDWAYDIYTAYPEVDWPHDKMCNIQGCKKIKCLASDGPMCLGKREKFRHFLAFFCHVCKIFLHLMSFSVVFAWNSFFWEKVPCIPTPRIRWQHHHPNSHYYLNYS